MIKIKTKTIQNNTWHLIDAKGEILGRLSTQAANLLRGKDKITFSNNKNVGDYVVIINARFFKLSGNKLQQKQYFKHTGYLGNLKTITADELFRHKPDEMLRKSISGMLPNNKLKKQFLSKLKIYKTGEYPHQNIQFDNE